MPASYADFDEYFVNMDISELSNQDLEKERVNYHYSMKNYSQLTRGSDSLKRLYDKDITRTKKDILRAVQTKKLFKKQDTTKAIDSFSIDNFALSNKIRIMNNAFTNANRKHNNLRTNRDYFLRKRKDLNLHDYQANYILATTLSCLLLFLLGPQ